ncbi:hypothetical protein JW721_03470 [Candidatus Micrarchaeota archaeon]|nr:hypothetical protein [Candidatus Micrarchaeota archaeon]
MVKPGFLAKIPQAGKSAQPAVGTLRVQALMAEARMGGEGGARARVLAFSIEAGIRADAGQDGGCIETRAFVVGREGNGKRAPLGNLLAAKKAYPQNLREGATYEKMVNEGEAMRIAKAMEGAPSFEEAMEIAQKAGVCRENGAAVCAVAAALESLGANGEELSKNLKESMMGAKLPIM